MPKGTLNLGYAQCHLPSVLEPEVDAWSKQGWTGVTQTTHDLMSYWFNRDEETQERFYFCQQRAIETIIYCHEVLQVKTLGELYERLAPEALLQHLPLKDEVESTPFPKYCLKMATGTGKTWVLAALLVWQYFNSLRGEYTGHYSNRFLVVTPGHEVLNRLLDSFKGKRDPKTGQRNPATSDYARSLFMPDGARWRDQFHMACPPKIGPLEMRDSCRITTGGNISENKKVFGGAGISDSPRGRYWKPGS